MWISMIFGCQSSIFRTSVDIHIGIQVEVSMQGHFTMDMSVEHEYPRMDIHVFVDTQSLITYTFIDIHLDIH